jgi:hypothetical protein
MPKRKNKNNWKRNLALLGALATATAAAAYAKKNYKRKTPALVKSTVWPYLEEEVRPVYSFVEAEEKEKPMSLKEWRNIVKSGYNPNETRNPNWLNLVKLGYNPKMPPNPFDDNDPRNFVSWGNRPKKDL